MHIKKFNEYNSIHSKPVNEWYYLGQVRVDVKCDQKSEDLVKEELISFLSKFQGVIDLFINRKKVDIAYNREEVFYNEQMMCEFIDIKITGKGKLKESIADELKVFLDDFICSKTLFLDEVEIYL